MRSFGSLTVRGRAFIAAGLTALVAGLILAERDIARMALVALLLPPLAIWSVRSRNQHLTASRRVSPEQLRPGEVATVQIQLDNRSRTSSTLLAEEQLPRSMGSRHRFVVRPIPSNGRDQIAYQIRPEIRGRHPLGPLQVRARDPFGLVEFPRKVGAVDQVLVLPRVHPVPPIRFSSSWFATGDEHPRAFSVGKVADVVVREYRRGDDLRRVHWRSSARMGELMVRNEEQLWQARATVILDSRAGSHSGQGASSSFETAIQAVASYVVQLSRDGYQVQLITASSTTEVWHQRGHAFDPFPILEELATLRMLKTDKMPEISVTEEVASGIVLAVLTGTEVSDHSWWARFPRHGCQSYAVCVNVSDVDHSWLTRQGWKVSRIGSGHPSSTVPAAWQELGG